MRYFRYSTGLTYHWAKVELMKWKISALAVFVWVSALQAEPRIVMANEGLSLGVTKIGCGASGEDLDLVVQSKLPDTQAQLKITLRNYGTVLKNALKDKTLLFNINDVSVGSVELSNGKQSAWNVRPSALADAGSKCEIKVTPRTEGDSIDVALNCSNLMPVSANLTLDERVGQRVASVKLSEPVTCSVKF
jgi:hypothetical protein